MLVEAVEHGEKALARNAEGGVAPCAISASTRAWPAGRASRGCGHGGRQAGDRECASAHVAGSAQGSPGCSNSPFGELSGHGRPHRRRRRRSARATPTARARRSCARRCDEFAEHGFGGARMDAHRRARRRQQAADLLLLRRQGRAVPRRARADLRATSAPPSASCTSRRPTRSRRCGALVAFTWNYYLAHPEFLPCSTARTCTAPATSSARGGSAQMNSPLIETLADVLERGAASGELPRRHRPDAALHLDRRPRLLLPLATTTRWRRSSAAT